MKKISILSVLSLAAIFVSAQTITINKKGLRINDVQISKDWTLGEFKKILGEPSKVSLTKRTYDDKGIIIWEQDENNTGIGTVRSMVLEYVPIGIKTAFKGELIIDGVKLENATTEEELNKLFADWKPGKSMNTFIKGNVRLYFEFGGASKFTRLNIIKH